MKSENRKTVSLEIPACVIKEKAFFSGKIFIEGSPADRNMPADHSDGDLIVRAGFPQFNKRFRNFLSHYVYFFHDFAPGAFAGTGTMTPPAIRLRLPAVDVVLYCIILYCPLSVKTISSSPHSDIRCV